MIGTGYLGATHAAAMAEVGHDVLGIDIDETKVRALAAGRVPFHEPGLAELLGRHVASGRLRFSTSVADAAGAELHFVCVGTPQRPDGLAADLRYVDAAFAALADVAAPGSVVVGKSTVPVGTAPRLAELLAPRGIRLVWNPEFLREGFAVQDTLRPDRIVIGGDLEGVAALERTYAAMIADGVPVVVTDFATAELVKVAANAFLATKISFINVMADVCEATGADVTELALALGHDERIGPKGLRAGLGYGGGCLPKDVRAFMARAGELGAADAAALLADVDRINQARRTRMVDLARDACGGSLAGRRVGVLGAAFKPDSDDVRDSPALDVAAAIQREGAAVSVFDPEAMSNAKDTHPALAYAPSALDACRDADVVLHLTEWPEFRGLTPEGLGEVVRERSIVDGRGGLDPQQWRAAGWRFRAIGRP